MSVSMMVPLKVSRSTMAAQRGLVLLTAFDFFIVWITGREYRLHRERNQQAAPTSPSAG